MPLLNATMVLLSSYLWLLAAGHSSIKVAQFLSTVAAALLCCTVELIERRNRHVPLHPGRQIQLATLVDSIPEGVFVVDAEGKVVEANQAAERLTGLSKSTLRSLPGESVARYIAGPGCRDGEKSQLALYRALRGQNVLQEPRQLIRSGAGSVEALISANPIREPEGRIVGALLIVRDITELAELKQYFAETERQNTIGCMAASLAHDFNNVLDTISQAVTILEVGPDRAPEERAVILRMIQNAVKRGSEIVANVRQFLTGGLSTHDALDLNTLLEETIELTRPMCQGAQVSLVRQFQPLPLVQANATEMSRVFTNLIINAIEAMSGGGSLVVGCDCKDGKVRAFIEDSGAGIPPEKYAKIFQPYYTTKEKGTGLGLSGALRAVRAQRGDITFTSRLGEGSRFVVELPAVESGKRAA